MTLYQRSPLLMRKSYVATMHLTHARVYTYVIINMLIIKKYMVLFYILSARCFFGEQVCIRYVGFFCFLYIRVCLETKI